MSRMQYGESHCMGCVPGMLPNPATLRLGVQNGTRNPGFNRQRFLVARQCPGRHCSNIVSRHVCRKKLAKINLIDTHSVDQAECWV